MFEHLRDDFPGAAGGDGHRDFSMMFARHGNNGVDRLHLVQQREILVFLFVRHGDVIDRHALFLA